MLELLKTFYREANQDRIQASFDFVNSLPCVGITIEEYLIELNETTSTTNFLKINSKT